MIVWQCVECCWDCQFPHWDINFQLQHQGPNLGPGIKEGPDIVLCTGRKTQKALALMGWCAWLEGSLASGIPPELREIQAPEGEGRFNQRAVLVEFPPIKATLARSGTATGMRLVLFSRSLKSRNI